MFQARAEVRSFIKKWLTVLAALAIGFAPAVVYAFSISPLKYLVTADPGTVRTVAVTVFNDSREAKVFHLSVLGAKQDERGRVVLQTFIDKAEAWVRPEVESIFVPAMGKKEIVFNIAVPSDAEPGAHYLGLAAEEGSSAEELVGLKTRLAALLTVQVAGVAREELRVERWRAEKDFFIGGDGWGFDWIIKNFGTIEVPVTAKAEIRNWRGKKISEFTILQNDAMLAGSERAGNEILPAVLSLWWPGKYTVGLAVDYGRTGQATGVNTAVWYVPTWSVFAAGGVIILFFVVVIKKRK